MRTFAIGLSLALVLTACTGRPDDPVFVFGGVQSDEGAVLADTPVTLWRSSGQDCGFLTFRERLRYSVDGGNPFTEFTSTRTDEEGLFLFKLLRFQVEPRNSEFPCFQAWIEGSPTGARTMLALNSVYTADVEVNPVYRLDAETVSFAAEGGAQLATAPKGPLEPRGPSWESQSDIVLYEWELASAGKAFWREPWKDVPLRIDSRLREDFAVPTAGVDMLGYLFPPGNVGPFTTGSPHEQYAMGPRASVPAIATEVAVSRGASCTNGETTWSPCPLTDGALDLELMELGEPRPNPDPSDPNPVMPPPLTIELATAARPTELIIRDLQPGGSDGTLRVLGSSNGVDFAELASFMLIHPPPAEGEVMTPYDWFNQGIYFLRVPLAATAEPITHVRIEGLWIFGAREFSFFE